MYKNELRPPAVPLVTVDPYFSVWSFADNLYDDFTRHWTGRRNSLTGVIEIDGERLIFAGKAWPDPERYFQEPLRMKQQSVNVTPLTTTYVFAERGVELQVRFTTPLLPHELELLSRPVSYVEFSARSVDGKNHDISIYFDLSGEWCVNTSKQRVVAKRKQIKENISAVYMGTDTQDILGGMGDDVRIDWGYLYLAWETSQNTKSFIGTASDRCKYIRFGEVRTDDYSDFPAEVKEVHPIAATVTHLGEVGSEAVSCRLCIAYDDIKSIEYFGEVLDAYWRKRWNSFDEMLACAFMDYEEVMQKCIRFESELLEDALAAGGSKYADLLSIAFRQVIAAHKLVCGKNGEILFFSKECFSNGCIATVDITYPSIPLFLIYNTELVKGMLRPVYRYAASSEWKFDFAPHDVGCYPKANGQVYGENKLEYQMPVEECGNMLISTAAVCLRENDRSFAEENWELIEKWGNYLVNNGFDPENQLCTDDFAGHLAHNCNLSVKAIMGIAGWAIMCSMMDRKEDARRLMKTAKNMAVEWKKKAADGDHYRLAFDQENTWSLKYNLIWDQLFDTGIFPKDIFRKELKYYLTKENRYGIPLDSRKTYTKADWLVWAASMNDAREEFERMIAPLWLFANETLSRVPFKDWYDTVTAQQMSFQHRSVLGGIFIRILKDKQLVSIDKRSIEI